jgi:primosomal protein N''
MELLSTAARENHHIRAAATLSAFYATGSQGFEKRIDKAREWEKVRQANVTWVNDTRWCGRQIRQRAAIPKQRLARCRQVLGLAGR